MSIWDNYKSEIYNKWQLKWFEIHPPDIAEYSWNYLFTDGKELHAKLFCELWGYLSPDSEIIAELAFAVECIHLASIIFNDTPWMHNANERGGKTTLHIMYSPNKALLIANNVITIAVDIWKNNKPPHVSDETWKNLLISKLQRLSIGQWFDLEKKGNLIQLASLKTGVLFELVAETVAIYVGIDSEFWRIWGNNLGVLFHWIDDLNNIQENKLQNKRNAFNETYVITQQNYVYLWQKIEKEIGSQWFDRPFGQFMKTYFTDDAFKITSETPKYNLLSEINKINETMSKIPTESVDEDINEKITEDFDYLKHFVVGISNKNIIKRIFKLYAHFFTITAINDNKIWNMSDEELESMYED
jgi:hypothetical protein